MENSHLKVKNYLLDLNFVIDSENPNNGTFVVHSDERGICNVVIAVAEPILIIEQKLVELKKLDVETLKTFLMKNRDIIHGALALAEDGKTLLFRDTLELENLDINELEATLNSLELFLTEFTDDLIKLAK